MHLKSLQAPLLVYGIALAQILLVSAQGGYSTQPCGKSFGEPLHPYSNDMITCGTYANKIYMTQRKYCYYDYEKKDIETLVFEDCQRKYTYQHIVLPRIHPYFFTSHYSNRSLTVHTGYYLVNGKPTDIGYEYVCFWTKVADRNNKRPTCTHCFEASKEYIH
ncbi:hypothetical protein O181_069539 [Austropuccinia psidii MF-1]|uniref:Secreted protein n=1 Tax=Austropuccinia psidii MF-1 TaxID=1389203 RepID=A0A9Q3I8L8_9BASI|nr:hypothetical protein [Austropuccinia psidii MF-1]